MADNELEFSAEVGLPMLSPVTAKASLRISRRWTTRADEFAQTMREAAGLSQADLHDRLGDDERLEDLALAAVTRITRSADAQYRDALAVCVARALMDEAKIDEVEHLTEQLIGMTPLHLRTLITIYTSPTWEIRGANRRAVHRHELARAMGQDASLIEGLERAEVLVALNQTVYDHIKSWHPGGDGLDGNDGPEKSGDGQDPGRDEVFTSTT